MDGETRVRVIQLQRRPFPGHYSMERVFANVRRHLPESVEVSVRETAFYNRGLLPRLRTVLEARRLRGFVTHVTGDINYAVLLLPRRRTLLTVHDTEFLDRASWMKRAIYRWMWLRLPVWRAGLVTVPSEATRRDLLRQVRTGADKVRVVPNPLPDGFTAEPEVAGTPPVVLMMGSRPNKNLPRAAMALQGLGCRVVVVGELDAGQRRAFAASGVPVEVRVGLSEEEVRLAYARCNLLLFPSTKEGFGIPILEAQASARPVVTSDRAPLSDVAGDGACLVDPFDVDSIRAGVERVLGSAVYRAELVRQGLRNVQRYRGEDVAARYAALYRELASRS